jgi:hypothetical protein
MAPQSHRKITDQKAFVKIKKHALRNIDNNPAAEDIRDDVAIVDTQLLSDLQARAQGKMITSSENAGGDAEPCADTGEGISFLNDVGKFAADELLREWQLVLARCVTMPEWPEQNHQKKTDPQSGMLVNLPFNVSGL